MAQVLFASPFECNQLNSNLADLQFGRFWKKLNIYNFMCTAELPLGRFPQICRMGIIFIFFQKSTELPFG